jgi:hypothetical protein
MGLAGIGCVAALVPISAGLWLASARFGRTVSAAGADRRIAQLGSAVVLALGVCLGFLSLFAGAVVYVAGSIWWAWSWSWPGPGRASRWVMLWAPALPWFLFFALGLVLASDPIDSPPSATIALFGVVSAIGSLPSLLATAGWLIGRSSARRLN